MTRPYVQGARAEAAKQTRRQILDAARTVVLTPGPLEFAVGDIATAASVARSTVYTAFGSRAGLLSALADDTLHRAGLGEVIAAYRQADPVLALDDSLRASCRMYAAEHGVISRLLVLAMVDPAAAEPLSRAQTDRGFGMLDLAGRLAAAGRLREGVTPARAADVLWLLTGFWTFDELFRGRGLDADESATILLDLAHSTLLTV